MNVNDCRRGEIVQPTGDRTEDITRIDGSGPAAGRTSGIIGGRQTQVSVLSS